MATPWQPPTTPYHVVNFACRKSAFLSLHLSTIFFSSPFMADDGLWGLFLLLARGETRSGCDGPDRSVHHVNFYTQTQVSACLADCGRMPSAVATGLPAQTKSSGRRFILAFSLKHQMYCSTKPVRKIFRFLIQNSGPLVSVLRFSFLCFSLGFYCCFYLFVPLPKHCLIPGSHAMFFFLFQVHKTLVLASFSTFSPNASWEVLYLFLLPQHC